MNQRFVFRYQLTDDHLRPAARWLVWHRFGKHLWFRLFFAVVMAGLATYEWRENGYTTLAVIFTAAAVSAAIGLFIFYPRLMKALMTTTLRGMEQVVTIDPEKLEATGPGLLVRIDWSLMWQVVARDDGLIVQPNQGAYWWLPFDRIDGEFRREDLGALLANLPVKVRG